MRVELLVDAKFDGCVKSHLAMVGEGRRESIPFAALYPQNFGREALEIHGRFATPSCKPLVPLKGKWGLFDLSQTLWKGDVSFSC